MNIYQKDKHYFNQQKSFKISCEQNTTQADLSSAHQIKPPKEKTDVKLKYSVLRDTDEPRSRVIAKAHIISHVINKIQWNRCYTHHYQLFNISAVLVIAELLSMYDQQRQLHCFQLFQLLLKKISMISKQSPQQIEENELRNYISTVLNYKKDIGTIQRCLKQFLQTYESRMMAFMPVYYLYFKLIAQKEERLSEKATVNDSIRLIKQVESLFEKYKDDSL